MPSHYGEEYVHVVGTPGYALAELNVAMFWPLNAEVFCPAKQDDLSYLLYIMLYSMLYCRLCHTHTLCRMQFAFSRFHPEASPVSSGVLEFETSNGSIEMSCSLSQSSPTSPNRRCWMFHFKAARRTLIRLSLGSFTRTLQCKGEPGIAYRILLLTNSTWEPQN